MNFNTLNNLGAIILFIGLLALFSSHISHTAGEEIELHDVIFEHLLVGLPLTLAGIACLLVAERMPQIPKAPKVKNNYLNKEGREAPNAPDTERINNSKYDDKLWNKIKYP